MKSIKNNLFILTGPPGSGKSSLINAIKEKNITCVAEFARAIIAQQRAIEGNGLYDKDPLLFKELMLSRAINDFNDANTKTTYLFDRGIPDLLAYSDCFNITRGAEIKAAELYMYNKIVFFAPSWKEIYSNDNDRKMTFAEAKIFGDNIKAAYKSLGYTLVDLPYTSIIDRANFIEETIKHNRNIG